MVLDDEHPNTNINEATPLINDSTYDGDRDSEHKMALFLELWFLVHVVGQMLVQLLTLGAIASKVFKFVKINTTVMVVMVLLKSVHTLGL